MDLAQATAQLSAHLQPTIDPVLTSDDIAVLLEGMRGIDADGKAPSDIGWTPTYDRAALASVVVLGWEMKAAKAVPDVNHAEDGAQFSASNIHDHCIVQADKWRKRIVAAVPLKRSMTKW